MAQQEKLKLSVIVGPNDIKPSATGVADEFEITASMGHNDSNPHKVVKCRLSVQGMPVRIVNVTDGTAETFTVKLNRAKPLKVRLEQLGTKEGLDEIELPADILGKPPAPKAKLKDFDAVEPMDPDDAGDFFVPVNTTKDGKHLQRSFQAISDRAFVVLDNAKQVLDPMNLETPASGRGSFYFRFQGRRITIRLVLDDGQIKLIDLVR